MLHAILICTDEACAEEFEGWGEAAELDTLGCEHCGCALQAIAFSEVLPSLPLPRLPRDTPYVRLRDAA